MLHRTWNSIAFALLVATTPAWAGEGTEKGAPTPKDLMRVVADALAKNELAIVKGMIDSDGTTADVVELFADLLYVDHVFYTQRAEAIKVFGKDMTGAVDEAGGFLASMHLDFAKLAESGKIEKQEDGSTAIVYESKPATEGDEVETYTVHVVERDARWYFDLQLPKDPGESKEMLALVRAMVPASKTLNTAIKAALTSAGGDATKAEAFRTALAAAGKAFSEALAAAGPKEADEPKEAPAPPTEPKK